LKPQLVIFIGIQAVGKSSFFRERFFRTHIRINLDMLNTRHREGLLFSACIESKAHVVVDNTNLTRADRARYILPAKEAGFDVCGYFFQSRGTDAILRNASRRAEEQVPELAIRGATRTLELPSAQEGFDRLYFVKLVEGSFEVEDWRDEI
jgi:predicted kinase